MKFSFLISLFLISLSLGAQETQDIVFKSRFDNESSDALINRLRSFLIINKFGDPYKQVIKKPIVVDLSKALSEMPEDTQSWIRELQKIFKMKLFDSEFKLVVEELGYSINHFAPRFGLSSSHNNRIEYVTNNNVNGLKLTAKKISFEVELKKNAELQGIKFDIQFLNPEFLIQPELLLEIPMGWNTTLREEDLLISLQSVDLRKVFALAIEQPELIDLSIQEFSMPDVSFRIGNKEIKFDPVKIENFFTSKKDQMKKGILDLVNERMQSRLENILKDSPEELSIPRLNSIHGTIFGVFDISQMNANKTGILQVNLDGHFCPLTSPHDQFCTDSKIPAKMRRIIPNSSFDRSMREINRFLIEKQANIAVSVSEHYINQLIEATIDGGLWEPDLSKKGLTLGPEKAFVLAYEKGETFSLFLDVIYRLSRPQRVLIGRSHLRFPVKMKIGLKIESPDGLPRLKISVKEVVTDRELILNGLPEYNLVSTVRGSRFNGKVVSTILGDLRSFEDTELIDLELMEFKDSYLEKLQFLSDGMGRGTAIINFGDSKDIL